MSMYDWAKQEVEIAKRYNKVEEEEDFDYIGACYDSALNAYKCLCDDDHSGLSFSMTRSILNCLMDCKPLTPIQDEEDVWNLIRDVLEEDKNKGVTLYQCKRMSSLFKTIYPDGHIEYDDVDRVLCTDINNSDIVFYSGLVDKLFDKLYPITLPYSGDKIKVFVEEFLTDTKNGDFDTVGIFYAIKDGKEININKYYKFDEGDEDWVELTQAEYYDRKLRKIDME